MKNVKKILSLILTVCMAFSVATQTLMPVTAYADSGNITSTVMSISTVVGNGTGGASVMLGDNGPAVSAGVSPKGVAVDGSGNLYIADTGNNRIRRVDHSTGYISTVAGTGPRGFSGDDGLAVSAQLDTPNGVAVDSSGNLYIADTYNHRIRRVDHVTEKISTVAGTGTPGFSGDNGPAASAELNRPLGVAVDGSGNLYIADAVNNRIRKVDTTGNISTIAGDGTQGFSGDNGPAAGACLSFPSGVTVDANGSLYIADTFNNCIRRVDHITKNISTMAGDGTQGFSGDNGPAASAKLNRPLGVAADGSSNLYIADTVNNRIRKVDATGNISTVAGDGTKGFSGDNGPAANAQLDYPDGVAVDGSGSLYIAESNNVRVRMVAPASYTIAPISDQTMIDIAAGYASGTQETRTITVTRGTGYLENLAAALSGGADSSFEITQPPAAALNTGSSATFTVKAKDGLSAGRYTETVTVSADNITNVAFTVTQVVTVSSPIISSVAGDGTQGFSGDNGPAASAWLYSPSGVAVDGSGNLYIADYGNNRIRRVDHSTANISTVAGTGNPGFSGDNGSASSAQLNRPRGVAVDGSGNLYIADTNNHRIRRVDHVTGSISTVAGTGTPGFSWDNSPAASAQLNCPSGVAVDSSDNLYIADSENHRIRRVDHSTGNISTVAGTGNPGFSGDNGSATFAQLEGPVGVAVDGSGNLYIADIYNKRIRRVDHSTGYISTVAGDGTQDFSGDNGPAASAKLNNPTGVAVDGSGNLYIADYKNNRIRRVNSSGWISTVAGDGTQDFGGDNGPAASAQLNYPNGVAVDGSGNLYITDYGNNRIRKVAPASYTIASISDQTMTDITAGYTSGTQETKTITVTRTGTSDVQNLAAALSGGAGSSFEITLPTAAILNTGTPSTAFTVKAKDGLAAGTYTATVTVSADNMVNVTFTVTQVVNALLPLGTVPVIQSAVAGNAHVNITWTGVTGATGYKIFKSTTSGSYSSDCNTANGAVYSYDVTELTNGVTYYFVVKAINGGNDSPSSAEVSAVPVTTCTVTFNSSGSVYTTKTVNAGESIGSAAWPTDPTRSSYTFGGWFTGENGAGTQLTSMTPVNATTTIYAKWTYSGGGGSSGSSSGSSTATTNPTTTVSGSTATTTVTPTVLGGTATGSVTTSQMSDALDKAKAAAGTNGTPNVKIQIDGASGASSFGTIIPRSSMQALVNGNAGALTLSGPAGSVSFEADALKTISGAASGDVTFNVAKTDSAQLSDAVKTLVGNHPVFTFSVTSGGSTISQFGGSVTVSVPYIPAAGEDTNAIVIYYIAADGALTMVPDARYDAATGMVIFTTTHFSTYAVGYNKVNFNDVSGTAWYSDAVTFLAARGITSGTTATRFSPDATLTRGQFITMLLRAYGISSDTNPTDNFADSGSTYYTNYLAAAKRLGISTGVGNNMFAPEKAITRQEMFTMLYNALKVIGQLPQGSSGKTFSDFTDAGQIDSWAKDAMTLLVKTGTVGGSDGKLTPLSTTTRAEMAQVLYNLLGK